MKRYPFTKEIRAFVYAKTDGHCAYCGCEITPEKMQIDHVKPLYLGGSNDLENLMPACASCNHYKSTYTLEGFRSIVEKAPAILRRDSATFRNALRLGVIKVTSGPVVFYFEKLGDEERGACAGKFSD